MVRRRRRECEATFPTGARGCRTRTAIAARSGRRAAGHWLQRLLRPRRLRCRVASVSVALKLKPNDADTHAARGYVERRQGRSDDAIASFKQAQALDPRNSALAYELGTTYQMTSRFPEAESAFQRALALDPDNRNARTSYS